MLSSYRSVIEMVGDYLNAETSLEEDSELFEFAPADQWKLSMVLTYRMERKRIWLSQLQIIDKTIAILKGHQSVREDT